MMHQDSTPQQLRAFGLLVGALFTVLGLWPWVWHGQDLRMWAIIAAGITLVRAVVMPTSLRRVYRGWIALRAGLGWINTRLLLGGIFFGVLMPLGLCMRWRGKDPMRRAWEPAAETYRVMRQPRPRSHMQQQF